MKLVRYAHRWNFLCAPQCFALTGVICLGVIAGLPACAQNTSIAPADEADSTGQADEGASLDERSTPWQSRMRTVPIESLMSSNLLTLRDNAESVFVGELTARQLEGSGDTGILKTRYQFDVESYLKGEDIEKNKITITNLGGRDENDGTTMSTPFSFEFAVGQRYLVFLRNGHEKMTLPIIAAFSIQDSGDVLTAQNGQRLTGFNDQGDMQFSNETAYEAFNYAPRQVLDTAGAAAAPKTVPSPSAGQGDVEINTTTSANTAELAEDSEGDGVTLEDVVDLISE